MCEFFISELGKMSRSGVECWDFCENRALETSPRADERRASRTPSGTLARRANESHEACGTELTPGSREFGVPPMLEAPLGTALDCSVSTVGRALNEQLCVKFSTLAGKKRQGYMLACMIELFAQF